jgi:hypothetical protein
MSYNIVRNKKTSYVSMVEKGRDAKGNVVTKAYICGLGAMTQEEFKHFQKWAHSIKDQRMRRERVLACPLVATETTRVERKVVGVKQRKTTVKRAPKKVVKKPKRWFPLPRRPTTHTEMMMERAKQEKKEKLMREAEKPKVEKWKPKAWFEPGMGK